MVNNRVASRLDKSEPDYFRILSELPIETAVCAEDYSICYANNAFIKTFWYPDRPIIGQLLSDLIKICSADLSTKLTLRPQISELNLAKSNGTKYWGQVNLAPLYLDDLGQHWIIQISDITDQKIEQSKLAYKENVWQNAIRASKHGVWDYFAPTQTCYYSDEWKAIRGFDPSDPKEHTHQEWEQRVHPDDLSFVLETIKRQQFGETDTFSYDYRERHALGHYIWISSRGQVLEREANGQTLRAVGTDFDITELKQQEAERSTKTALEHKRHLLELEKAHIETKKAHEKAAAISRQDPLTSLPNRRAFSEKLDKLTKNGGLASAKFGVLIVDLDRFKPVNDTHGHSVGDSVICEAAERIKKSLGNKGMAARLGGDEFGILVPILKRENLTDKLISVATSMIAAIEVPITTSNIDVEIGASIGIAKFPDHGQRAAELMRNADLALYEVKKTTRGCWAIFTSSMANAHSERSALETGIRHAVKNNELVPFFQPTINLDTMQLSGFEVLSRWTHPELGEVSPQKFIPLIEQFKLNKPFGDAVISRASKAFTCWPAHLDMSLNVSACALASAEFPDRLLGIMEQTGFSPKRLIIEVSESIAIDYLSTARAVVGELRSHGIRLALDNFGTGYSGLKYLQWLEFDYLKMDRSFTKSLKTNTEARKVMESVVSIAENFDLNPIVIGIEDSTTLKMVREMGYKYGQGYYFSKALSAMAATDYVTNHCAPSADEA